MRKVGILRGVMAAALVSCTLAVPLATRADNLQDLSSQLSDQNRRAAETSDHIADVSGQIAAVQQQINDTQTKIATTNTGIADAKNRLAAQEVVLGEYMRQQYQTDNQTGLEILVGSPSFSAFVNKETYLQSGQDRIAKAVQAVVETKKQLETEAASLDKLNAQLAAQQNGLNYEKSQAENQLAGIEAAQNDLKAKLAKYSSGRVVQAGDHVNAGDLIGFEGTSGCSTGPHLHFEVDQNGTPVNPGNYTPGRFRWPLDAGFSIAQGFGPANWSGAPYSFHTGFDLAAYYGAPVYAAGDGTVTFSGYDRSGFGDHVTINHGGGLQTLYGHLGARSSDYPNC